ncbi:GLPGLI family protein [Bacteroidota bacterium]
MKKTMIICAALMMFFAASAQNKKNGSITSGTVVYEEITKLDIKLDGDNAQFADMLPKENKNKMVLLFNEDASLYKSEKVESDQQEAINMSGISMKIYTSEPQNIMYYDFKKEIQIEQKEFLTRVFLIQDDLKKIEWKMTGNQKSILDYPCQEATRENEDGKKISAWFTPSIPVSSGPSEYVDLPGLVLAVNIDDGKKVFNALSIDANPVDKKLLVKPKKGKKVTNQQYTQIVKEKMEEMNAESGGSVTSGGVYKTVVLRK